MLSNSKYRKVSLTTTQSIASAGVYQLSGINVLLPKMVFGVRIISVRAEMYAAGATLSVVRNMDMWSFVNNARPINVDWDFNSAPIPIYPSNTPVAYPMDFQQTAAAAVFVEVNIRAEFSVALTAADTVFTNYYVEYEIL
jgi:hypothetical protein